MGNIGNDENSNLDTMWLAVDSKHDSTAFAPLLYTSERYYVIFIPPIDRHWPYGALNAVRKMDLKILEDLSTKVKCIIKEESLEQSNYFSVHCGLHGCRISTGVDAIFMSKLK